MSVVINVFFFTDDERSSTRFSSQLVIETAEMLVVRIHGRKLVKTADCQGFWKCRCICGFSESQLEGELATMTDRSILNGHSKNFILLIGR